jgi:molecular chaperone DnaK
MGRLVGIDFGSSKSMLCAVKDGKPVIVPNAEGAQSTPSVVAFAGNGEILVGEIARRQAVTNPRRTVRMIKRRLGTAWKTDIDGQVFTAQHISAFVLRKLVRDASSYLGEQVTDAVVAVPACFDVTARQAIREAGRIAGLNVQRIIGATEATALTYLAARSVNATMLVFGLGAGAFEISVLTADEDLVGVEAASGDNHLGGDDWDQRLVDHLVQEARNVSGVDLSEDQTALQRLHEAAEQAKIDLSSAAESQISVPYITQSADGPVHLQTTLTRAAFQAMTADLLARCMDPIDQVMKDAGIGTGDIGHVVLAGGATRMPAVAALVRKLATGKEPARSVSPDEAVAVGAARLAGALAGTAKSPLLISVTPWSLGVKTKGGIVTKLIERNTMLPARRSTTFGVSKRLQAAAAKSGSGGAPSAHSASDTGMMIEVYQGENTLAADNQPVGVAQLTGLPLAPGRWREIELTIDVDRDAVPRVVARDTRTGSEQSVVITRSPAPAADEADTVSGAIELEVRPDAPVSRPRDQETIDLQPSPEAARAAREHRLGRLRQSFTVAPAVVRAPPEIQVFEFEQGFIQQGPGSPPDAFRWDQIATVLHGSTATYYNGSYQSTSYTYTITSHEGQSAKIASTYRDPARSSISADDRVGSARRRYAALGAAVARQVATAQLPAAKAALDRGEKLTFGKFALSVDGVWAGRRGPLAWSQVSEVQVTDGVVDIKQFDGLVTFARRRVSKIPNFLLFTALADMLRNSRPA